MKKFLLILTLCFIGFAAKAQVGGIVYQPLNSRGQSSYKQQSQQRTIRATAYSFDSYNNTYIKHPIKVIEYYEYGTTKYRIVEEYKSYGYGGQWEKLPYHVPVSQCSPMFSSNSLESQFTHKANMLGTIYYFDL